MRQLWAPWRLAYVQEAGAAEGCVFCQEAAGELGAASLVVHRGERVVVLLNKFPYSSGHLMVAPVRHVPSLGDLDPEEAAEIHALTVQAIAALTARLRARRLQRRLEPRCGRGRVDRRAPAPARRPALGGDTNFMPVLADVKVLPEHLESTRLSLMRGLGVIRELAENPNVHQPLSAGPRARHRPGRAVRDLPPLGHGAAQRHRAARTARGRRGRARRRGDPCDPPGARPQRRRVGARRVVHASRPRRAARRARASFPTRTSRWRSGWCSPRAARSPVPPGTSARRVESVDELVTARRIQHEAFGGNGRGGRVRAGGGRLRRARASTARRSSRSSTASPSRPGTPRTRRSACCSSAVPRSRRRGAAAPTGRSSPPGPARRRRAARPSSSPGAGRCRARSSSGSGSRPVARIDRLLDVFPA